MHKSYECLIEAQKGDKRILEDTELETIYNTVNFQSVYEVQRWNILIFGFRTGLRPESLERLQAAAFKRGVSDDGRKYIMPLLGTMKNQQGLDKAEMALLQQKILSAEDERCGSQKGTHKIQVFSLDSVPWLRTTVN